MLWPSFTAMAPHANSSLHGGSPPAPPGPASGPIRTRLRPYPLQSEAAIAIAAAAARNILPSLPPIRVVPAPRAPTPRATLPSPAASVRNRKGPRLRTPSSRHRPHAPLAAPPPSTSHAWSAPMAALLRRIWTKGGGGVVVVCSMTCGGSTPRRVLPWFDHLIYFWPHGVSEWFDRMS